jgi:site-specific DNA-methyltransferase (adenine-specific)
MITTNQQTDLLPQHTETEIEALRDDLKAHGLKVPVIVDEDQQIIDGRLRAKLCDELSIDWRQSARVEADLNVDQKAALRIKLNLLRRSAQPNTSQRREYVRTLIKAEPQLSNGTVGKLCGMDSSSVSRIRSRMETNGEAKAAEVTTGLDGRIRQKPQGSERPKIADKGVREPPTENDTPHPLHLPQGSECTSAETLAQPQNQESSAELPVAANDTTLVSQPSTITESAVTAPEGRLEFSELNLKLVKAMSANDGRWEWLGEDGQGNRYLVNCRRIQEVRKAG